MAKDLGDMFDNKLSMINTKKLAVMWYDGNMS